MAMKKNAEPKPDLYAVPHGPEQDRVEIAKHQGEYRTLHAINIDCGTHLRTVVCWKLSWRARLRLLFTGTLWHSIMRDGPLQPILITTRKSDHYEVNGQ